MRANIFALNTFSFCVDQIPFGYAYNFDNYLFNKIKHINTQGLGDRADYFLINNVKKRIEAKIHFLLDEKKAYSPYKSLFGSFEFNPKIHPNLLGEFWGFIESDLKSRKIENVKITNFAGGYAPKKAEMVLKTMDKSGFHITLKAVNHHITIDEDPLDERMHSMEKRRLNKCKKNGFTFREEPLTNANEIYDYIQSCREEQGLKVSLPREKFMYYLTDFPQNYPFFSVRMGNQIMAATITIKIHRHILYNFLPGSLRTHKQFSPTVLLNAGLYNYCRNHQFRILDLGISTEPNGRDQETLIDFKERIGGEISYKYYFEKSL